MDISNHIFPQKGQESPQLKINSKFSSEEAPLSWTDFNKAPDQIDLDGYTPADLTRIANGLGKATRSGNGYSCLCPAHNDHHPSGYISLGEGGYFLACCYAGCDSWAVVKKIHELGLLTKANGLSSDVPLPLLADHGQSIKVKSAELEWDKQGRVEKIWGETQSVQKTPAETYLRARIPLLSVIPDVLRFHSCLWHQETKTQYRGMVAKVSFWGEDHRIAIHQTFLNDDGMSKASIEKNQRRCWGASRAGRCSFMKRERFFSLWRKVLKPPCPFIC